MKSDLDDMYKGEDLYKWSTASCSEVIKSIKKALQKKCRQCSPDEKTECKHTPCSVIFAFDEARGLQIKEPNSKSMTLSPFYQIRRALRMLFDHQTFIAVMLDTSA
ncbi:hypothetical protein GOP47_0021207 [Adiantum capillus-veneris]|uniref:Uncharacterized protein n=1 Tax=Adiantum capillus-veneris TaxID=13818 RepID=A0A9D4Z8G1_ADICA|nr:hypothetical protein GOP47_0021207 [Adiantum capillus-veneris]